MSEYDVLICGHYLSQAAARIQRLLQLADRESDAAAALKHLRRAVDEGVLALERLEHDEEFYQRFRSVIVAGEQDRRAMEAILHDIDTFKFFLAMEKKLLTAGGLPEELTETLIEACQFHRCEVEQAARQTQDTDGLKRTDALRKSVQQLRQESHRLADDLHRQERAEREERRDRRRAERQQLGILATFLAAANAGLSAALLPVVGLGAAAAAVSALYGGEIVKEVVKDWLAEQKKPDQ